MVSLERFASSDYQLTGSLTEVPHLGDTTCGLLKKRKISSTYQLLGHFLAGNRDKAAFVAFLRDVETPAAHRNGLANAIATRVSSCGVKLTVSMPSEVDGKVVSSKLDDVKASKIQQLKFNNVLAHDFPGVGFGKEGDKENVSLQALRAHDITTTDQLFGAMLKHIGEDASKHVENVVAFWKELGAMGVAHSYKTTIIEGMKLKLDIGIDNCARPLMSTNWEEEPASPPGTGQQTRTRPLSADAHAAAVGAHAAAPPGAYAAAPPGTQPAMAVSAVAVDEVQAPGVNMKMLVGAIVLAGVACWLALGGSSSGELTLAAPQEGEWV